MKILQETDKTHSRNKSSIQGENAIAIIKKGCPVETLNEFAINNCANSVYHGMAFSIDMLNDKPNTYNFNGI